VPLILRAIDGLNIWIGRAVSWLLVGMVAVMSAVVLLRYVFGVGFIWLQELVIYQHAAVIMLAGAAVLARDGHVRVDVLYRGWPAVWRARVNAVAAALFIIPTGLLLAWISWPYVRLSWLILERSRETSGLPAVFLLKTLIPLSGVLLALQGLVIVGQAFARPVADQAAR
jgi:TRAP-type mannitol/chloroaromatic compound transport system permease small subunit